MVMGRPNRRYIPRHPCGCGCGQQVNKNRSRFIRGHYVKLINSHDVKLYDKENC